MEKLFDGKVIIITGASSGIGEATALMLAEGGSKVVPGARSVDKLTNLCDRIVNAGGMPFLKAST